MHVSTSYSGRASGVANRTPLVAMTGTRNASASETSISLSVFVALQMPLQLDVDLRAAEDADQPIEQPADAVPLGVQQRPAGERDEPADWPSRSSSVSAPSPFGARSFMRVIRRQRLR